MIESQIFRNRNEVDNHIYEVCESTCHECSAKDEVEHHKEDSVVGVHSMKESSEKAMEVNNEPRLNVDEH